MADPPPTRWSRAGNSGYAARFAELVASGADVDGEARLADALLPRGGRVLDVGSGMGRVAAALTARGHRVTAVEPDPDLVARSRATYPGLAVEPVDVLAFAPPVGTAYDLVVCVGNVLVYLAEGTEREVLARLRGWLTPGGRVLVGLHPDSAERGGRDYDPGDLAADVGAAGLRVEARFGSYELHPPRDEYVVWLLAAAD